MIAFATCTAKKDVTSDENFADLVPTFRIVPELLTIHEYVKHLIRSVSYSTYCSKFVISMKSDNPPRVVA